MQRKAYIYEKMEFALKKACRYIMKLLKPHHRSDFLFKLNNSKNTKILDVGCGNKSPELVKGILNKVYYIGIDVGDYNQSCRSKKYADEYYIVTSDRFANKIEQYNDYFDAVICSHNLEHCDEPDRVLKAISKSLKKNGKIYLAFPCEESVNYPNRRGTLNFYDDPTHNICPEWNKIITCLESEGIQIIFSAKNYSPIFMRFIGRLMEAKSKRNNLTMFGTWEYYGFESIIWGRKL